MTRKRNFTRYKLDMLETWIFFYKAFNGHMEHVLFNLAVLIIKFWVVISHIHLRNKKPCILTKGWSHHYSFIKKRVQKIQLNQVFVFSHCGSSRLVLPLISIDLGGDIIGLLRKVVAILLDCRINTDCTQLQSPLGICCDQVNG